MALKNKPWRASVSSNQVQCNMPIPLRAYTSEICTSFLNDAESLTMFGYAFSCSQIVYTCPYSLNTTTAFYFATECSDVTAYLRACAYHNTFLPYLALTRFGPSVTR